MRLGITLLPKELYRCIYEKIVSIYPNKKICDQITKTLLEHYKICNVVDLISNHKKIKLKKASYRNLQHACKRLQQYEPLQYVLGKASFYGYDLIVNPACLIPRPETEEMTDYIIKKHQDQADLVILDLCTGSGCIAISLEKHLENAIVYGLDISKKALSVAQKNQKKLKSGVHFFEADVFKKSYNFWEIDIHSFDIMVSNPPYVTEGEKVQLDPQLFYEPSEALFVPDKEPFLFYKQILKLAKKYLNPSGKLYMELNTNFADKLKQLLEGTKDFREVTLHKDLQKRYRFISASKV